MSTASWPVLQTVVWETRYDRATETLTRVLALAVEAGGYLEMLRSFGPRGPVWGR